MPPLLEVACFNAQSAIEAASSGANRIELCASYPLGGTTPLLSTFISVRHTLQSINKRSLLSPLEPPLSIHVMIRPRGGNFIYSEMEFETMLEDVQRFYHAGASGFVFGILTTAHLVDILRCRKLIASAGGRPCVFHRAFDIIANPEMEAQMNVLIECGFTALLTSGNAKDALEGRDILSRLINASQGEIDIIIGGGLRSANVEMLLHMGAEWIHTSAITNDNSEMADVEEVKLIKAILHNH
ncbi:Copper homeostasis protein CutC [Golovinomyces cichoracearum]|uniref:Copper homeostasis protein cutC homolog n=1 Tax=Golovinomyces cichoracearum TaxID=62708 RepID=A0A420J6V8_9PEZI|nr:Copper homeostasis protein CutC [Golovinomyces cichoracearum]